MRHAAVLLGLFWTLLPAAGCTSRTAGSLSAREPAPGELPLSTDSPESAAGGVAQSAPASAPALATPTRAADGSFPAKLRWNGRDLLCNGTGLCEWGILGIDLYVAAFYAERRVADLAHALDPDQRTVVHLHFVRKLTAAQLREAFTVSTRVNTGERFASVQKPLQQLLDAMATVQDGDRYTFLGEPGRGLTIARNDREVGRIEDDAFRRLFLRLYLGDQPPTAALRDGLLGKQ